MAEMSGWQQGLGEGIGQLFWLASELDPSAAGRRRRQREKGQLVASAGVVLPGESGRWQEGVSWLVYLVVHEGSWLGVGARVPLCRIIPEPMCWAPVFTACYVR